MFPWRKNLVVAMAMAFMLWTASARADDEGSTMTVTGRATATEKAEILRLTLSISAQGSDVRDALAKLSSLRDELKSKLLATGADEVSMKFSDPVEGNDGNLTPQQRMMQQMMSRGQRSAATQPSGVTVSSVLTAEWLLPPASADDALATASELQAKIKAAIPKGGAAAPKTPEEQEVADEMAAQMANAGVNKPNEPQFLFVHKLTDDERTKLIAQAFADAQAQGRRLASAAGLALGAVHHLSTLKGDNENPTNSYIEALMDASTGAAPTSVDGEASGAQRNNINYTVTVTATFMLNSR